MTNLNRNYKRLTSLDLQVLATLAYSAQFEFPLLSNEVAKRLVTTSVVLSLLENPQDFGSNSTNEAPINHSVLLRNLPQIKQVLSQKDGELRKLSSKKSALELVEFSLEKLVEMGAVVNFEDYYGLNFAFLGLADQNGGDEGDGGDGGDEGAKKLKHGGRVKEEIFFFLGWIRSRRKASGRAAALKAGCRKLIRLAIRCPMIKAIAITGSVAAGSAKKNDDIDLLVVTKLGTLWLVRGLVLLASVWWGKKRLSFLGKGDSSNLWCFNIWLGEGSLQLPYFKRTAYDALEAIQIGWIFDEEGVEKRFYQENSWMSNHLVNFYQPDTAPARKTQASHFLRLLNKLFCRLGSWHLHRKNKIPYKNLKEESAFLHDGESHLQYTYRWKSLFWLSLSKSVFN